MCCSLEQVHAKLVINSITMESQGSDKTKFYVDAIVDRRPESYLLRFFQRTELIEKIAEIADESFHILASTLKEFSSPAIYQTLSDFHHAAHHIEHLLHSICFFSDITRIMNGNFIEYIEDKKNHKKEVSYLLTIGRVAHTVAHFLATLDFLVDNNLISNQRWGRIWTYSAYFSIAGYAIWTISLIWRRVFDQATKGENRLFYSNLAIHLGGFFFYGIPLTKKLSLIPLAYVSVTSKLASLAGIIHAACIANRLLPQDEEKVKVERIVENKDLKPHVHAHACGAH